MKHNKQIQVFSFRLIHCLYTLGILFLFINETQLFAQNFQIPIPKTKVSGSRYSRIYFYDGRPDTVGYGTIQVSATNIPKRVFANPSLSVQCQTIIDSLNESSDSAKKELLLHLRHLSFSETTGFASEKGFCLMRAALYVRHSAGIYQKLAFIDTLVVTTKTFDATRSIMKKAGNVLTDFITQNITKTPEDTTIYKTGDIKYADNVEKSRLPLYASEIYKDGIYLTYESFSKQKPDKNVKAEIVFDVLEKVSTVDVIGKEEKMSAEDVYAVVFQGKPYMATEYGYYPLVKNHGDFYYTGRASLTGNGNKVFWAQYNFGLVGALIAASEKGTFLIKIDHLTGNPMCIRRTSSLSEIR